MQITNAEIDQLASYLAAHTGGDELGIANLITDFVAASEDAGDE